MAKKNVVVTTIGTCRIAEPIMAAAKVRNLKRNNSNIYGFVHTSKEVLQQIDFMKGQAIPDELGRFLASDGVLPRQVEYDKPDLFIVEISSTKEINFGDRYLQINYMERAFHGQRDLFEAFFKLKNETDQNVRAARFETIPAFADLGDLERQVLLTGYVHHTTREELEADMVAIAERLDIPVMFVSHINVPGSSGLPIESRARLCTWVREICETRAFNLFDPTSHVENYGRERALQDSGRDINHYTTEFKLELGAVLFDRCCSEILMRKPQIIGSAAEGQVDTGTFPGEPDAGSLHRPQAAYEHVDLVRLQVVVADAKKLIAAGDLDEAEALLRGSLPDDHRSAAVHTLLGTIGFHRGDTSTAAAELRHAVELDPSAVEPRLMLVRSALRVNKYQEACSIASELIRRAPDDLRVLAVAGKAMMKAKHFNEATFIWRRIAALRPELTQPLIEVARCEMKSKNYEEALSAAEEALNRDPREAAALVIKADALQRMKRMKELAQVCLDLAAIDPKAAMAAVPALVSSLHPEEAARVVAAARHSGENDIDTVLKAGLIRTLESRGKIADERGDTQGSAAAWKAVLLVDPRNARATSRLRRLLGPLVRAARDKVAMEDYSGAVAAYRSALSLQEDSPRILRDLAIAHEKAGEWLEASARWLHLAELDTHREHFVRAARCAVRIERYDLAIQIYGRIEPDEQVARSLGSASRKLVKSMRNDYEDGHLDNAARKANVILQAFPQNEAAQRVLRKVVSSYTRHLREAVVTKDVGLQEEISHKILVVEPRRTVGLKTLAKIYGVTKRHRESIEIYQRLTEVEPNESRHWIKLARSCRAVRLYDRGVPAALRALEMEPGNPDAMNLLSDMLNRQAAA